MATIIEQLATALQSSGLVVGLEHHAQAILAKLATSGGRTQVVKVSLEQRKQSSDYLVRLTSRACKAEHHSIIKEALKTNSLSEVGSLSLNTAGSTSVIDVRHSLVAEGLQFDEFVSALRTVAFHADAIEQRMGGGDKF
jgi:hypothetical protein